jgi:hypothetical protein
MRAQSMRISISNAGKNDRFIVPVIFFIAFLSFSVFATTSPELVKNGDFSSTTVTNWTLAVKDSSVKGAITDQAYVITRSVHAAASDTNNYGIQLSQGSISLEKGKSYVFSFTAKADSEFTASINVGMNKSPWTSYSGYFPFSVKTVLDTFSFEFKMDSTDAASRIVLDIGWMRAKGTVTLDNISLKSSSSGSTNSGEILLNWDFSSTVVANWPLNLQGKGTATKAITNGQLVISITKCDTFPYCIQLDQTGIKLVKGASYNLTWKAKADSLFSGGVYAGPNHEPWGQYGGYGSFSMSQDWDSTNSWPFTVDTADNSARIAFDLGGMAGPGKIYFDYISLKRTDVPVKNNVTADKKSGFHAILKGHMLQIQATSPITAYQIFNASGKELISSGKIASNCGMVSLVLNPGMSKGVYFVKIMEKSPANIPLSSVSCLFYH